MFSVRLVSADSYQAQPLPQLDPAFSEFRGSEIKHVPILRIFGSTPTGEKTCLHIHGVFPYMYVPYTAEEDPASLSYRLAASLDAAINVSLGSATSNTQHVYSIQRVSGIPFYGYHKKEHQFLKIYFYNPAMIKRAADLLQNGSVLNQSLQPHEAHIPYILQFMMDYNVYGMSMINLSVVKHRREPTSLAKLAASGRSESSESNEIDYLPSSVERQSTCQLEIDANAADILNRREIESGLDLNPGLAAIWEEERARRAQAGLQGGDSQLVNPKSPPRPVFRPTDNDIYQEQRLARRLLMISQCDESTLSTTTNQSIAYAAEVRDGENLLNSSCISVPSIQRSQPQPQDDTIANASSFDSPTIAESQKLSANCSVLGTEDMSLVDLLVELAGDNKVENAESVDNDSVLGSQVSLLLNDDKSDMDEDDADDLNLTCLQLDSLSGFQTVESIVERREEGEKSLQDKSSLSTVHLSPFLTPNEAALSVPKSSDEEATDRRARDTNHQIPQYDGAGDLSPTFADSSSFAGDNDIDENTKDFDNPTKSNETREDSTNSRISDFREETNKFSCRAHTATVTNDPMEPRNIEDSTEIGASEVHASQPSILTSDVHLGQYSVVNYEPYDRMLEIDPDFIPDLEGMHSSMEIGILLSGGDSDSPESIRQEEDNEDSIPLDAVLNGDPCFTESAELDKSDITELRDQYASLLDNSLLPDVHTNPRIADDPGSTSNCSDSEYRGSEKARCLPSNGSCYRSTATSRDSSSSSENITPNIQEPESRNGSRGKSSANADRDDCKMPRFSNDNSDYNCNFVASWTELQNAREDKRLCRLKDRRNGQSTPDNRQNRRRANKKNLTNVSGQSFGAGSEDTRMKLETDKFDQNPCQPLRSGANSLAKKSTNAASITMLFADECNAVGKNATPRDVEPVEERLSNDGLPRIAREAMGEENNDKTSCRLIATAASLEAFHRSIIGSENPSGETIFAKGLYPSDSFLTPEHFSEPEFSVFDVPEDGKAETVEEPESRSGESLEGVEGASDCSARRSKSNRSPDVGHRHCVWSPRQRKIVQDQVFTADEIYVIEKRKRGRQNQLERGVCTRADCKLPFVILKKFDCKADYRIAEIVEASTKTEESPSTDRSSANSADSSITGESSCRRKSPIPKNKSDFSTKRKPRGGRKRVISDSSSNENSSVTLTTSSSDDGSRHIESSDWAEREGLERAATTKNKRRQPYNTRSKKISFGRKRNYFRRKTTKTSRASKKCSLPGIPGIIETPKKRGRAKKISLKRSKDDSGERTVGESTKSMKPLHSGLFPNWGSRCEILESPSNDTAKISEVSTNDKRAGSSSAKRKVKTPKSDHSPAAQLPKRQNNDSREIVEDSSPILIDRSSIKNESDGNNEKRICATRMAEPLSESEVLGSMMKKIKCPSTRAKLKLLMESRRRIETWKKSEEKPSGATVAITKDYSLPTTSARSTIAKIDSPKVSFTPGAKRIDEISLDAIDDIDDFERSESCEFSVVAEPEESLIGKFAAVASSEAFEACANDESSRQCEKDSDDSRESSIVDLYAINEENFFTVGNSYTIDAVSLEMPTCLFADDSNSMMKTRDADSSHIHEDSFGNAKDNASLISVDPRDLEVCDIESLTSTCSSATKIADVDPYESLFNDSELSCSTVMESTTSAESTILPMKNRFSRSGKTREGPRTPISPEHRNTDDSISENDSPLFETLSPRPRFTDLPSYSPAERFNAHSELKITENTKKFDDSFVASEDSHEEEGTKKRVAGNNNDTQLDGNKIAVSQIIERFDNARELREASETPFIPATEIENSVPIDVERYEEVVTTAEREAEAYMDIANEINPKDASTIVDFHEISTTNARENKFATISENDEKSIIPNDEEQWSKSSEAFERSSIVTERTIILIIDGIDEDPGIANEEQSTCEGDLELPIITREIQSSGTVIEKSEILPISSDELRALIATSFIRKSTVDEKNDEDCMNVLREKELSVESENSEPPPTAKLTESVTSSVEEASRSITVVKTVDSTSAPTSDEYVADTTDSQMTPKESEINEEEPIQTTSKPIASSTLEESLKAEKFITIDGNMNESCVTDAEIEQRSSRNGELSFETEEEELITAIGENRLTPNRRESYERRADTVKLVTLDSSAFAEFPPKSKSDDEKLDYAQESISYEFAKTTHCCVDSESMEIKKLQDFDKATPTNSPRRIPKARKIPQRSQPLRRCTGNIVPKLSPLKSPRLSANSTNYSPRNDVEGDTRKRFDPSNLDILEKVDRTKIFIEIGNEARRDCSEFNAAMGSARSEEAERISGAKEFAENEKLSANAEKSLKSSPSPQTEDEEFTSEKSERDDPKSYSASSPLAGDKPASKSRRRGRVGKRSTERTKIPNPEAESSKERNASISYQGAELSVQRFIEDDVESLSTRRFRTSKNASGTESELIVNESQETELSQQEVDNSGDSRVADEPGTRSRSEKVSETIVQTFEMEATSTQRYLQSMTKTPNRTVEFSSQDIADDRIESITLAHVRVPSLDCFSWRDKSCRIATEKSNRKLDVSLRQRVAGRHSENVFRTFKRRGRRSKNSLASPLNSSTEHRSTREEVTSDAIEPENSVKHRKLGRPRKIRIADEDTSVRYSSSQEEESIDNETEPKNPAKPKKFGRPRKEKFAIIVDRSAKYSSSQEDESIGDETESEDPAKPKKLGRPRNEKYVIIVDQSAKYSSSQEDESIGDETEPKDPAKVKKRGRPRKEKFAIMDNRSEKYSSSQEDESIGDETESKDPVEPKKLGRPKKEKFAIIVDQSPKYPSSRDDESAIEVIDPKSPVKHKKLGLPRKKQIATIVDPSSPREEAIADASDEAENRVKLEQRGRSRSKSLPVAQRFSTTQPLERRLDVKENVSQNSDQSSREIAIEDFESIAPDKSKGRGRKKGSTTSPRDPLYEAPLSREPNDRDTVENASKKSVLSSRRRIDAETKGTRRRSAVNYPRETKLPRQCELVSQKIVDENIEPTSREKREHRTRLRQSQRIKNCISTKNSASREGCERIVVEKIPEPIVSLEPNMNEIVDAKPLRVSKKRFHSAKNLEDNECSRSALTTKESSPHAAKATTISAADSPQSTEITTKNHFPVIERLPVEDTKMNVKPKSLLKRKNRVRFDEESICRSAAALGSFHLSPRRVIEESSPRKLGKRSPKSKRSEIRTRGKIFPKEEEERSIVSTKIDDVECSSSRFAEKTNGVERNEKSMLHFDNDASLDLSTLQIPSRKLHRFACGEFSKTRESICQDENLSATRLSWMTPGDTELTEQVKYLKQFDLHTVKPRGWKWTRATSYVQLKMPRVQLKRLSRDSLRIHGIALKSKAKKFVQNLKKFSVIDGLRVPAYDGAADFSSSESEDEKNATIAREENRVCIYRSAKKTASSTRPSIFTPRKRKLDVEDDAIAGPSCKRSAATESAKKSPYRSPNRTSMLKSPGRLSGYYSPLPIIVTSPKVRKETSVPLINTRDPSVASSSCVTPRRKQHCLRESVMRGRITATKSSRSETGEKSEVEATTAIKRSESATPDASEDTEDAKSREATTPRDGKDVRKRLVFPTIGEKKHVVTSSDSADQTSDTETRKFNANSGRSGDSAKTSVAEESIEIAVSESRADPNFAISHAAPGSSRSDGTSIIRDPYEVTTDEDSDDDEDACNITFSQYVDSQMSENRGSIARSRTSAESSDEIMFIRPKFYPPSRRNVAETMEMYGIPKHRNQEPFFSDESDVPKHKELAHKILKVPGKGLKDMPAFVSSVEGVTGIARWRKMRINELNPSLAKAKDIDVKIALGGNETVVLTPLAKPPTRKEANDWLRAREYLAKKKRQEERETKKKNDERNVEIVTKKTERVKEPLVKSMDSSDIVPSTKVIDENNDEEDESSRASKMRLAKSGTFENARGPTTSKSRRGSEEDTKIDSQRATGFDDTRRGSGDSTGTEIDPSLLSILGKSRLFREQEASKHLGVSCGQIEFLSESTRSNVANENLQKAKALTRYQYLTIMCLEVHVTTRGDLLPDAQRDAIAAIFYSVQSDVPLTSSIKPLEHGVIVLADTNKAKNKMYYSYATNVPWSINIAKDEEALLNSLVNLITLVDPEILIGWELETLSWGYVFQRAASLGMNLYKRISRIPSTQGKWEAQPRDIETLAEVKLPGRIVLDIWRLMRHEAALLSYTFESVMHHVLNERISCPSFKTLTDWWNLESPRPTRWRVIEHYSIRILGIFRLLDQLDIIGRTSELARLFGIQFFEVFSRGSQYRVESVMLRLAKPLNYIAVSPSSQQRASMRAMEALPLIMEPESMFYSDPLIVLDFQSLYPSIIIAHNYCFSTCLGRIEHIGQPQPFEFGAYTLRVPKSTSLKLQGKVNFAPCGVAFVKPEVRLGVLPRMLTEILETRFMVKKAMKDHDRDDKTLQRALHSRQMGLKFLANVTYGYTAANFSGRMPCIEVGDSVISKSKETLERAIKLVETTPRWGARVVYGDTDSLFILVPGKSKADAFVIGNEIADAVTAVNPPPIKLKFEKVMYPAILQTKKRYCGYMYETPEQEKPTYLAKGIETVRRDGCPAVSKILEKTLKILFETKDVSLVKKYVTRQLDKVLRGKVSIQDLTFAKEFRGLKGYKARACVPALELTKRLMQKDPRAVPRHNERVRYVIVAGAPNQALIHCVRTPWELINDPGLRPNSIYYVTRVIIPPLNRCLNLMGVDVNAWYRDMPHRHILNNPVGQPADRQKSTIFQYFGTIVCAACGQSSNKGICADCVANPVDTVVILHDKIRRLDRQSSHVTAICQSCIGQADVADCASLDCPVLYRRAQAQRELTQTSHLRSIIECGNNLEL